MVQSPPARWPKCEALRRAVWPTTNLYMGFSMAPMWPAACIRDLVENAGTMAVVERERCLEGAEK